MITKVRGYDADVITALVNKEESRNETLRARMDADYRLYRLDDDAIDELAGDSNEGYRQYISNDPMTFADKVVSWLVGANLVIRQLQDENWRDERERENNKERFHIGTIRANDERLLNQLMPALRDQLAWYVSLRGRTCGRALLALDDRSSTYVDITPWDPLHVTFGVGRQGLKWICHKINKTASELEDEYDIDVEKEGIAGEEQGVAVYDWYDESVNLAIVNGQFMKKPTLHGSPRVPAFYIVSGPNPPIYMHTFTHDNTISDYGESIFKATRKLFSKVNLVLSIMLHLVALARKHPFVHSSRDGRKTLDESPWQEGVEIPLSQDEKVELLQLLEMSRDTGAFLGLVSGHLQRGALPYSIYGELQFQLSGYAINVLNQGIVSVIQPRFRAIEQAYAQICNLLYDQYQTGAFGAMQLSGQGRNRDYFDQRISPESIAGLGAPEVKLLANLPQDEVSKYAMAQQARQGPTPLLPDLWIWDNLLGLQDADMIGDAIKEQMGERMSPMATLHTLMQAMEKRGRTDLAKIYMGDMIKLMMAQGMGEPGRPGGTNGTSNGNGGLPPEVAPNATIGRGPPAPNQQQGPIVEQGRPRPGARTPDQRLSDIGLFGPRG